jgi:hypothetical protein
MNIRIFLMINLIISSVYATSFELKDARGHGIITLEREWTLLKETLGIPFLFVSKGDNPNSSIGITFTGIKNAALNPKSLKTTQDKYRVGRKKWAKKSDAKILLFKDYKNFKNKNKLSVHSVGHNYKQNNKLFFETSYYLECPKNFVHIKTLIYEKHNRLKSDAARAIESFKCK